MKKIMGAAIVAMTLIQGASAGVEVIYGTDDRQDIYQVKNDKLKQLARSTAGMIKLSTFSSTSNKSTLNISLPKTLEVGQNICATENFSKQYIAPICSGFLIGPDTLITAGHCYNSFDIPENVCEDFAWVFDYSMKSATDNPTQDIAPANVYRCKEVLAVKRDMNQDYAIIKLDRVAAGRAPVKFRKSGKIPSSANLVMIGHPTGLPTKIDTSGKITYNNEPTRFSTNLDSFHGNSGSAVFNAQTGMLEGILIMGKTDYIPKDQNDPTSCQVTNVCDNNAKNCKAGHEDGLVDHGEVVLRITEISSLISSALRGAL